MKRILSMIVILALAVSLCACAAKWTDEDITRSTKIEITKYESDNPNMVKRIWFAVGIVALSIIILTVIWIILGSTTGLNENTSIVEQHEIISP